jgi:predicted nucleic acid-binding Zn ribbon protein
VLRRLGLEQKFKDQQILGLWPDIAGPQLAARTRAMRIERGVLYVHVTHGAWMQELHFMERELVDRLRERAPGVDLQRIRFTTKESA